MDTEQSRSVRHIIVYPNPTSDEITIDFRKVIFNNGEVRNFKFIIEWKINPTRVVSNYLITFAIAADIEQNEKVSGSLNQTQLANLETIMQDLMIF